ncbi:hypothetical protein OG474_27150 [Kribbella sp. NBC_01505]|uniref:hypothetical protein n=1 Tax=Kribbella sp. NBC_01505 TaxID=2903580 RepID=UPI00386BECC5
MIPLHMGGVPETAMVLGPILLIIAFVRIARRNEASGDAEDDWDADLGDLPPAVSEEPEQTRSSSRPG